MKGTILILLALFLCLSVGCAMPTISVQQELPAAKAADDSSSPSPFPDETEETLSYIHIDNPWYASAEEVNEALDGLILCKITSESYRVYSILDSSIMPNASDKEKQPFLYTVYSVETAASFVGEYENCNEVRLMCTEQGKNVEAQMAAYGAESENALPVYMGKYPDIEVGCWYVLVLAQFGDSTPAIMLTTQSVFPLKGDPEKITVDDISLKELMRPYGDEAWETVKSYCQP